MYQPLMVLLISDHDGVPRAKQLHLEFRKAHLLLNLSEGLGKGTHALRYASADTRPAATEGAYPLASLEKQDLPLVLKEGCHHLPLDHKFILSPLGAIIIEHNGKNT